MPSSGEPISVEKRRASNISCSRRRIHSAYLGYGAINQAASNLYSNFDALQLKWAHQDSHAVIQFNYTYGKSLGICCGTTLGGGSAKFDPFNLRANYGALPGDRRQIFNAAYSFDLGNPYKGNKFVAGVVDGWQLSGTTELQSGANPECGHGENFNLSITGRPLCQAQLQLQQSGAVWNRCDRHSPYSDMQSDIGSVGVSHLYQRQLLWPSNISGAVRAIHDAGDFRPCLLQQRPWPV